MVFSFILQNSGSKPKIFGGKWELNTPLVSDFSFATIYRKYFDTYEISQALDWP
jgi:hypothetical protein